MKIAIILGGGNGTRIWPYAELRPKVMIPVANKPLIQYNIDKLLELGIDKVIIAGGRLSEQIANHFHGASNDGNNFKYDSVNVVSISNARGTAFAVKELLPALSAEDDFFVFYGDTIISENDIKKLFNKYYSSGEDAVALVDSLDEEAPNDWICCKLEDGRITRVLGHPRATVTHRFGGFAFNYKFLPFIQNNSGIFTDVQVGVMPPAEGYLEMSAADYIRKNGSMAAVETEDTFLDIDKPWHILTANYYIVNKECRELTGNILGEGASIHESASVKGYVKLGKGSRIGRNVIIDGSLIVGDNTIIDNGAIINGNAVIGDNCFVANYCSIGGGSSVGNRCVVKNCAEFSGMILDGVHLFHYMEFYGIIGCHTDLGAATVCGTLRFDDGGSVHKIKGRKEYPHDHSNAIYLGDYCRTGVNVTLMPGCKVGPYSLIGPGVLLQEDVPNNTSIFLEQQHTKKQWGPERYGW